MPIDASKVKWDDDTPDPTSVKWDDAPSSSVEGNGGAIPAPAIPADLEQILGPSDFTKAFASTPARMVKSAMQMVGAGDYVPDAVSRAAAEGDKSTLGRIVGDVAGTGGIRAGVGRLAQSLQALNAAKGFLPAVGRTAEAATYGATQGAITSPDDQANAAAWGAGGGAAGQGLGRVVQGFRPTKEAQQLIDQGIQPSVGQSVGGVVNRIEQALASNPVSGAFINPMRQRPMQEFEAKVLDRATRGGAKTLDEANAHASQLYEEVVPSLKPTREAVQGVQTAARDALQNPEMTDQNRQLLLGLVQKHFANFGQLDGQAIKRLDSELGYLSRKYASGDPASRTLAGEIQNVQQALREGLEPGLPADLRGKLQTANAIYRELIPINKAASTRADEAITPRALQKAMARQQRTDVTRMKPDSLVDPAVVVLPRTVPDSGTAERLITNALPSLLVGGGMGAQSLGWDTVGTGMIAAGALGSRPGARALTGSLPMQQALAEALRRGVPSAMRGNRNDN